MAMESDSDTTETAAFTQALASLKRRGSNLLVVGATSGQTHGEACNRLLGESSANRSRVFVSTDEHCGAADRHVHSDGDTLVEYAATTRGAAAAQPSTAGPSGPSLSGTATTQTVDDLPSLGTAVGEAIDAAGGDALAPAELRLCFDSLTPLLEEHDESTVFRFLHALTSEVRAVNGMGHYHLPVAFDNRMVRTLRPLFDAVVEVRSQGDRSQQRWHLSETDITTDWLDL